MENTPAPSDPSILRYQEIAFSVLMTGVALLSNGGPEIVYPAILWTFEAMLAFNLGFQLLLRRVKAKSAPAMVSAGVNLALISLALHFSGGWESPYWPLYLLPIFTACLHLRRRHAALALAAACAFLALFYLEAVWETTRWQAWELCLKISVLAISTAVTGQLSHKARVHRLALEASRERVEQLARSLERRTAVELAAMQRESLRSLIPGIAHNLNNPLTVIMGTVELMLNEAPEDDLARRDLLRIQSAARACAMLTADLQRYLRQQEAGRHESINH